MIALRPLRCRRVEAVAASVLLKSHALLDVLDPRFTLLSPLLSNGEVRATGRIELESRRRFFALCFKRIELPLPDRAATCPLLFEQRPCPGGGRILLLALNGGPHLLLALLCRRLNALELVGLLLVLGGRVDALTAQVTSLFAEIGRPDIELISDRPATRGMDWNDVQLASTAPGTAPEPQ